MESRCPIEAPGAELAACSQGKLDAMDQETFGLLETETAPYYVGNRTRSTALLAWFIETIMRRDPVEVEDAICDGGGDKGIDALLYDDDANELFVLQSKHRNTATATQGDVALKEFVGVAVYFADRAGIENLLDSGPNDELRALVSDRLHLADIVEQRQPAVTLVFVTNAETDAAGEGYIRTYGSGPPPLDVWQGHRLAEVAQRTARQQLLPGKHVLEEVGDVLTAPLVDAAQMALALVPATQLVRLPGIENLTLFDLNVRLGLGNTKINRELRQTIKTASEHALFPAYHNGLTILTDGLRSTDEGLELDGIAVVNGCQSLLALYRERASISPDLKLVVKVVELGEDSELADRITYRSNNQNPVNLRDQRSTDLIQRDLQQQLRAAYDGLLFYEIRRGQPKDEAEGILDNQLAAQILMAVWLGEPWNAVRKIQLFDQEYYRIFRRASSHQLYLAYLIDLEVQACRLKLRPELQTAFASVRFTLDYLVGVLLRQNELGSRLLDAPDELLPAKREDVAAELNRLAEFVVDEINYFVQIREEARSVQADDPPFDPKTTFKSQSGIREVERQAVQAMKAVARRPDVPAYFELADSISSSKVRPSEA
jgi:hypothetical protein